MRFWTACLFSPDTTTCIVHKHSVFNILLYSYTPFGLTCWSMTCRGWRRSRTTKVSGVLTLVTLWNSTRCWTPRCQRRSFQGSWRLILPESHRLFQTLPTSARWLQMWSSCKVRWLRWWNVCRPCGAERSDACCKWQRGYTDLKHGSYAVCIWRLSIPVERSERHFYQSFIRRDRSKRRLGTGDQPVSTT